MSSERGSGTRRVVLRILTLPFALLLAACASERDLYRWGSYEECVRETCRGASAAHSADWIRRLTAEIAQARAEGRLVGPGMHAQLGYLDERTGDHESAVLEFTAERELYPESAVFIDGLLRPASAALSVIAIASAGSSRASPPSEQHRSVYLAHMPRSILVLPPRTETPEADVASRWLSTITRPLAERGYYVFPVAVVDAMLRENGLKSPLADLAALFGADAVLDVDIQQWGRNDDLLEPELQVTLEARLLDVKTGTELWRGTSTAIQSANDGSQGGVAGILVDALSTPIVALAVDPTTGVARQASWALIHSPQGLLFGPRHPEFEEDPRKHRGAAPAKAP